MSNHLYGPTSRSPEPSPPEFDDPGMVDPQDLDADGRRAWIAVAGEASKDELLLRLMGENDALRIERDEAKVDVKSLVMSLKLIEHATSPTLDDGGAHENAYTLARKALSVHKWGVE